MNGPEVFRKGVLGKKFDVDGYYGAQCWDGYAYYMKWLGYPFANCTTSGYVKDIWENRKTNGMRKWCDEVEVMQQGDICVFKEDPSWTPHSHIAIFIKDLGNGRGLFLGQNQGGINGAFNEVELPYSATYPTAFRPKCYKNLYAKPVVSTDADAVLNSVPSDFIHEKATFTCTADRINIRKAPSLHGVSTGDWYEDGMSVNYDGSVNREGYVWISWIGKSGTRYWMAAGELINGANKKPYGTFK